MTRPDLPSEAIDFLRRYFAGEEIEFEEIQSSWLDTYIAELIVCGCADSETHVEHSVLLTGDKNEAT